MNRKFKNFLRRALTGLLSITMIAGEFPVAALAAEPKAAVEEEAVYEEEAAAVSEDEVVAEVSEDETEVPAVSEDEAEEAVAETEETEEAAAETEGEDAGDAEASEKETADVEAEESEDGAMVPYLTYKLTFNFGTGKDAKALFDAISANNADAGKAYTDSLYVTSGSDNFDKTYINVDGDDRAVILSRDKADGSTFVYGSNSENEDEKSYSLTYTLSVNETTVVKGVSENTGYRGFLVIKGFDCLDGNQYMSSDDIGQYWDFSDSALYLVTDNREGTVNYDYRIRTGAGSRSITWNNDSSDDSVRAMVAYSDPETTDPVWHTLAQGENAVRYQRGSVYVKLAGFTRVPSTYVLNAFGKVYDRENAFDAEKDYWLVDNGTITLSDGDNRPFYTVNIHNANKSGNITFSYKNQIEAAYSKPQSIGAGAVISGTAGSGLYGDSWSFDSVSINVTVGEGLRFRYAFGPKKDKALADSFGPVENEGSISLNMAELLGMRPTEIDGKPVDVDEYSYPESADQNVVWDLWVETAPAYEARYAAVDYRGELIDSYAELDGDGVDVYGDGARFYYADETNKDLLLGTEEKVLRNLSSYGKGSMGRLTTEDGEDGAYLQIPAGETWYIRVFGDDSNVHYNVSLPTTVSAQSAEYSVGPIYTKVSENKAGVAYAALTDSELKLISDGYYSLTFSGSSKTDFTGNQVIDEVKVPVALGLTATAADRLTHKVNFEFEGDGASKSNVNLFGDSDNVQDGRALGFTITPKNGWRVASVSGASLVDDNTYYTEPLYHDVTVKITTEYDPRNVVSVNFVSGNAAAVDAVKKIHFMHITDEDDYYVEKPAEYTYIGSQTGLGQPAFTLTSGDRFEIEVAEGYIIESAYIEGTAGRTYFNLIRYDEDENDCYYTFTDKVIGSYFKTDIVNKIFINAKKVADESHKITFVGDVDKVKVFTSEQKDGIYDDIIEDSVYATMDDEFSFMVIPADGYTVNNVYRVDENDVSLREDGVYTLDSENDVTVKITTRTNTAAVVKYFTIKADSGVKKLLLDGNELKNIGNDTYEVVLKRAGRHYLTAEFNEKKAAGGYIVTPFNPGVPYAFSGSYMLNVGSRIYSGITDTSLKAWENGTVYIHTYDVMDDVLPEDMFGLRVFNNEKFANVDSMYLMNAADGKSLQNFSTSANESVRFVEYSTSSNAPAVYLDVEVKAGYDVKILDQIEGETYTGEKYDGGVSFNNVKLANPMSRYILIVEPHVVSQIFHVPYGDLTFLNEKGTGKLGDIYFDAKGDDGVWIVNGRRADKPYTVKASEDAVGFMTQKQYEKWLKEPTVDNWKFLTKEKSLTITNPQEDAEYWVVYNPYFTVQLNDNNSVDVHKNGSVSVNVYKGGTYRITYYNQFGKPFTSKADAPAALKGDQSSKLGLVNKTGSAVVYVTNADGEDADLTYTYSLGKGNNELFPDGTLTLKKINPSVKADTLTLPVDTFGSVSVDKPEQMGEDEYEYDEDDEEWKWINYYQYDYDKSALYDPHITWNDDDEVYDFSVTALPAIDGAAAEKEYSVSVNGDGFKLGNIIVKTVKPSLDGKTLPAVKDPQDTAGSNSFTIVVPTVEELEKAGIVVDETLVGRVYWKVTVKGETGSNIQYFNYWKTTGDDYVIENGNRVADDQITVTGLNENREYEWTLQLVQTGSDETALNPRSSSNDNIANYVQFSTAATAAKTVKTLTTYYATKLKLSKTSATVFTGQKDVAVADITFPESQVSFRQDDDRMVQIVDTAKSVDDDFYDIDAYGFKYYVKNGTLYISAPYNFDCNGNGKADDTLQARKFSLEVRTRRPADTYWTTAKLNLTLKQGIQTIDLGLKNQYAVLSGNGAKPLTIKMKPVFNGAHKDIMIPEDSTKLDVFDSVYCPVYDHDESITNTAAPSSKKVDWNRAVLQYNAYDEKGWVTAAGNTVDGITLAKGALSIASGEFYGQKAYRVLVPAADYAGSEIWSTYGNTFTVTNADDFANSHLVLIDRKYTVDDSIGMKSYRIIGTEDGKGNITVSTNELDRFAGDELAIVAVMNDAVIAEVDGDNDGVMEKFVPCSDLAYETAYQYGLGLEFKPVSKGFKLAANGSFTGMSQTAKRTKITASLKNNSSAKALNGTVEITYSSVNFALEIRENDPDMEQYYWDNSSLRNVLDKKNFKADRYKDTASYYGTESTYITLGLKIGKVQKGTDELDWVDAPFNDPNGEGKNFTVKVKGGKLLKPVVQKYYAGRGELARNQSYYWLSIKPGKTATAATVTITNKQDKSTKTYTITNNTVAGTAKVKVTADMKQLYDKAGETQAITFKAANAPAEADYLKIERNLKNVISSTVYDAKTDKWTLDSVTDDGYEKLSRYTQDDKDSIKIDGIHSVKASENFKTKIYLDEDRYVLPGSYKYVFTYGTKDANGEFKPLTAPTNVTVKIKGDKAASFKLKTSYTLAARDQFKAELAGSAKGVEYVSVDEVLYANLNGNNNKFKDVIVKDDFSDDEAAYDEGSHWSHDDFRYHNDAVAINAYQNGAKEKSSYLYLGDVTINLNKITAKTDLTGYIRYTVHYKKGTSEMRYGKIKVSLNPDEKKTALKFKATSKGAIIDTENSYIAAYAEVTAGGKPVNLVENKVSLYSPNEIFNDVELMDVEAVTNKEGFGVNGVRNVLKLTGNNLENLNKMKGKTETVTLYVVPEDKNLYLPVIKNGVRYYEAQYENGNDKGILQDTKDQYGIPVQVKIKLNKAETVKSSLTFSQTNVPEWGGMDQAKGEAPYTTWWNGEDNEDDLWTAVPVTANLPLADDLVVIKADGWDADDVSKAKFAEFIGFEYETLAYGKSTVKVVINTKNYALALEKDPSLKGKTVSVTANVYIGKYEGILARGAKPNQQVTFNITLPDPAAVSLAEEKAAIEASIAGKGALTELIKADEVVKDEIEYRLYGDGEYWNYVTEYIDAYGKYGYYGGYTGKNALISNISATHVDVDYENGIAYITLSRTDADGNTESAVVSYRPNVEADASDYVGVLAAWAQANRKLYGKADITFGDEAQNTAKLAEICAAAREAVMLPANIGLSATLESNENSGVLAVRFTLKDSDSDFYDDEYVAAVFSKGLAATIADAYVAANGAVNEKFFTGALSANNADKDITAVAQAAVKALPYDAVVTFTRIDTEEKINKLVEDKKIDYMQARQFTNALALGRLPFSIVISNVEDTEADNYAVLKSGYAIFGLSDWARRDARQILNVFYAGYTDEASKLPYINEDALLRTDENLPDYSKNAIEAAVVKQAGGNQFAKVEILTGKDEGGNDQFKEATDTQSGYVTIKVTTSANIARGVAEPDTAQQRFFLPQKVSAQSYTTNFLVMAGAQDYVLDEHRDIDFSDSEWVFKEFDRRADDEGDGAVSINGAAYGYERYITDYVAAYPVDKETSVPVKFKVTYKRGSDVKTVDVSINLKGNTYGSASDVFTKGVNKISMEKVMTKAELQAAVNKIKYNATSITVNSDPAVVAPTKLANGTVTYDITVVIKIDDKEQKLTRQVTYTLVSEGTQTLAEAKAAVEATVSECAAMVADGTLNWSKGGAYSLTSRVKAAVEDTTKYDAGQYSIRYAGIYDTSSRYGNDASALTVIPAGDYTDGSVKGTVYIKIGDAEAAVAIDLTIPADKHENHSDVG